MDLCNKHKKGETRNFLPIRQVAVVKKQEKMIYLKVVTLSDDNYSMSYTV